MNAVHSFKNRWYFLFGLDIMMTIWMAAGMAINVFKYIY